jgi:hypothetical protein
MTGFFFCSISGGGGHRLAHKKYKGPVDSVGRTSEKNYN